MPPAGNQGTYDTTTNMHTQLLVCIKKCAYWTTVCIFYCGVYIEPWWVPGVYIVLWCVYCIMVRSGCVYWTMVCILYHGALGVYSKLRWWVCSTYSSQLLSTDIRSDAPHEQGGGEVEGAGLRRPHLLSLLLTLLVSLSPFWQTDRNQGLCRFQPADDI